MDRPDDEFEKLETRLLAFQKDLAPTHEFVVRMRSRLVRHDVLLREGARADRSRGQRFWSILSTRAYAVMTAFTFVIFTGGLSTFAYTSDGVTHGNVLYSVKRGLERIESALAVDSPEANAEFQVKMLGRRLAESRSLVLSGIADPSTTSEVSLVVDSGIEAIAAVTQDEYRNQLLDQVATMLKNEEQKMYETAGVTAPVAPVAIVAPAVVATPVTPSPAAIVSPSVGAIASPASDIGKVSSEFIRSRERIRLLKEKMGEGGVLDKKVEKEDDNKKRENKNEEKKSGKNDDKEQKKNEVKKVDSPAPTPAPSPVTSSSAIPVVPLPIAQVEVIPAPPIPPPVATSPSLSNPSAQNVQPNQPILPIQTPPPPVQQDVPAVQSPQENVPTSLGAPSELLKALEKTSQHFKQMEEKVREVKEREKEKEKHEQGEKKGKGDD